MKVGCPKIIKQDGETLLSFPLGPLELQEARLLVMRYAGKVLSLTVKLFRKPRTKHQNDYLWTLCQAIAQAIGVSKEDVYRQVIRDYGQYEAVTVKDEALQSLVEGWQRDRGLGWFVDTMTNYDGTTTALLYFGSSSYDTEQLSRLLDALVDECDTLGLDVQIPDEIKALLREKR